MTARTQPVEPGSAPAGESLGRGEIVEFGIPDWFEPGYGGVWDALAAALRRPEVIERIVVRLRAERYEGLRGYVHSQSERQAEEEIRVAQRKALAEAADQFRRTEEGCADLIRNVTGFYGARNAA